MRIALVQDYLKEYGGAEAVFETLTDLYPKADIFTSLYAPSYFGPHRSRLQKKWDHRVRQSFFKYIPFAHKIISPLRLLSPLAFKSFDFSDYDLIISSATGAYFPNAVNKKSAKLICYCHTPPRYLYGLPTARNFQKYPLLKFLANIVNHFLRLADFKFSQNVDQYIANSQTTASRIKKFYRRPAIVINPPIEVPKLSTDTLKKSPLSSKGVVRRTGGFYLTGGRLARAKRYDIAILACKKLNLPLKIFGRDFAGFETELRKLAGSKTEFLGEVTQSQKETLFKNAKAYLFCSDNEDFGMVSVEAQALGCPVIGYNSGGIKETVVHGKTGFLFDKLTPDSCAAAIQKLNQNNLNPQDCHRNALKFSRPVFIKKIRNLVTRFSR